ncbi:hypothetical protein IEE86_05980 [Bacillus sp. 28A-2]|nr:hypothetical protein [Bacillus sp. 28A-2]
MLSIQHHISANKKADNPTLSAQHVDKPSHSLSGLRAGAHECPIRSAPVLVLPRLQGLSITLKRRQRAKIKIILALCQPSKADNPMLSAFSNLNKIKIKAVTQQ